MMMNMKDGCEHDGHDRYKIVAQIEFSELTVPSASEIVMNSSAGNFSFEVKIQNLRRGLPAKELFRVRIVDLNLTEYGDLCPHPIAHSSPI